ncbi:hypothetical protein O4328_28975 [Rhodococcus opacus]|uniref:Recombinase n=1 Tax=Rhodococcus opacus TaxID=37919 RepID=A0AAX3YS71_RHOOP|nr:hypothetical protein [Rhodococcus opacus]MCZ4587675.1 hypothetical protein [Rhodococcus opacus]WLF51329.1 hypothetical protein Q5707_38865 [Rhodococcus opacus]
MSFPPRVNTAPAAAIGARYRYDWELFADWCTAVDLSALPADPLTIAMYLDEHTAATSTHRRRVTAINTVHHRSGYPKPGTAHALRERLTRRTRPRPDLRAAADDVIRRLPTTGWPGGLFGRRDALLLTLACRLQLSPTQIGRLKRSDVTFDGHTLRIPSHGITIDHDPDESPRTDPVAVYLRWARLQAFTDRTPSNRWLGESLTTATPVTDDTSTGLQLLPAIRHNGPLLPSFDKWGHANMGQAGLSRRATTRILTAHLTGAPHARTQRQVKFFDDGWADAVEDVVEAISDSDDTAPVEQPELSADEIAVRYEAGLAARRGTAEAMADLTTTFEDLDDRTDELLARIQGIFDTLDESADSSEPPPA